jgi:hypothetical protein
VRDQLRRRREVFVPLHHAPGHAQADFGEALVVIGGIEQPTSSRSICRIATRVTFGPIQRQRQRPGSTATFMLLLSSAECRCRCFYDNDRCLVTRILADGTRKRARLFSGFLSHYLIQDRYGHPGKGNNTGSVERLVG